MTSPEAKEAMRAPAGRRSGRVRRFVPSSLLAPVGMPEHRGLEEAAPSSDIALRESLYRRGLAFADVVGAVVAVLIVVEAIGDDRLRPEVLLMLPLVVAVAKIQGLYDRDAVLLNKTTLDEAPKLFQAATLYTLLLSLAQAHLVDGRLSPTQLVGLWLIYFGCAVAGRWLVRRLARRRLSFERVLVIGGPLETQRIADKLRDNPTVNARVIGRISLDPHESTDGTVGTMDDLEAVVSDLGVHRAIVAPSGTSYDRTLDGIRAAKAAGVQVSVLPRLLEVVGSSVEFDSLYGMSVLGVRRFGLTTSSEAIKRGMDFVGAAVGLVLLSPLFAVIALLIKRSGAGPVFFRQRRVGKAGEVFEVVKFRTMVDGADGRQAELAGANFAGEGLFKIEDDPRVTRIGRFLRRSSLDELPQLLNVWRGEMSLVGPRPLIPEQDKQIEGRHRRRLHLKPGMTGQWQIFGSSRVPMREMVTIDYLYVANWSLWGDVKILCRTIPYMLARRGV